MTKRYLFLLLFFGISLSVSAQKFIWQTELHSFFDNNEFAGSQVQTSQTMAGVSITPQIGISFQDRHRIYMGVNLIREFGSSRMVDFHEVVAYYQLDNKPFRFYMGAFPRHELLSRYPRMFFQDSIQYYRPIINGFFWELYRNNNYANVWLDWTSRQSYTHREAFFMGWSGRYNLGLFYGQHFGYMFHFAGVKEPEIREELFDNGLILTSLGIDLASRTNFDKLELNVGWSVGLERYRDFDNWHTPHGFLSEFKIEYQGIGIFNTFYRGRAQQVFHHIHSNELYWGDPIFRLRTYNRTDFYVNFVRNDIVNVKFTYTLHFAERTLYHRQALHAKFNLGNVPKRESRTSSPLFWENWFN